MDDKHDVTTYLAMLKVLLKTNTTTNIPRLIKKSFQQKHIVLKKIK